jgi:neural Wiskott-Aldrich syndrome protein
LSLVAAEFSQVPMSQNLASTLARASDAANAIGSAEVGLEHVLLSLCHDPDAEAVLSASRVDVARLQAETAQYLGAQPSHPPGRGLTVAPALSRILEAAAAAARGSRRRDINGAIVLAAIIGDAKSVAAQILQAYGLTFDEAIRALQASLTPTAPPEVRPADDVLAQARERVQSRSAPTLRDMRPETPQVALPPPPPPSQPSVSATLQTGPENLPGQEARGGEYPTRSDGFGAAASAAEPAPLNASPAATEVETQANLPNTPESERPPSQGNIDLPYVPAPEVNLPAPAPAPHHPQPEHAAISHDRGISFELGRPTPVAMPPPIPPPYAPYGGPQSIPMAPPPYPMPPRSAPGPSQGPMLGAPPRQNHQQWNGPGQPYPPAGAQRTISAQFPPPAPPPAMQAPTSSAQPLGQPSGQPRAARTKGEAGQLAENIPRAMRVGNSERVEIRLAKAAVKDLTVGLDGGGAAWRHDITVTQAMSVRLRAPDGGFFIETVSPETQWIENQLGFASDDFASWRFLVTPNARGWARLQIVVSARTVGSDGIAAETALPDQLVDVKVRTNYKRTALRWMGWTAAAVVGGALAKFGEGGLSLAVSIISKLSN